MTATLARRYTIGALEIYGGLSGFAITAPLLGPASSWLWRVVLLLILLFFAACCVAGVMLVREHSWGASLSLYLQIPQLLFVYSSALIWQLYCGVNLSLSLTTPFELGFFASPDSTVHFTVNNDLDHVTLGVNVVAAFLLWQLYQYLEDRDNPGRRNRPRSFGGTV